MFSSSRCLTRRLVERVARQAATLRLASSATALARSESDENDAVDEAAVLGQPQQSVTSSAVPPVAPTLLRMDSASAEALSDADLTEVDEDDLGDMVYKDVQRDPRHQNSGADGDLSRMDRIALASSGFKPADAHKDTIAWDSHGDAPAGEDGWDQGLTGDEARSNASDSVGASEMRPGRPEKPPSRAKIQSEKAEFLRQRAALLDPAGLNPMYARELELETRAIDQAVDKYRKLVADMKAGGRGSTMKPAQSMVVGWFPVLVKAIRAEIANLRERPEGKAGQPNHFLTLLGADTLAVIAMHEVLGSAMRTVEGARYVDIAVAIGSAVEAELNLQRLKRLNKRQHAKVTESNMSVHFMNLLAAQKLATQPISPAAKVELGGVLITLVISCCKLVDSETPAFDHYLKKIRGKPTGYVRCSEEVLRLIEDRHELREALRPRYLPMLVPPKPWTDFRTGGYLTVPTIILRPKGGGGRLQIDALKDAYFTPVLEGLNVLSQTKWRINKPVWNVMQQVWDQGGGIAGLPSRSNVTLPVKPSTSNAEELKAYAKAMRGAVRENANRHSLRSDLILKMQVATEFEDEEFYFPHNMDFRGRAYPVPPHLNHLGADNCRGILVFSQAKALGQEGLRWLKIHLANLHGADKLSFDERVTFTENHMPDILDSAENPLTGKRWWIKADDPWQCLATCMELAGASRSPDPTKFMSSLPVHQDGSCNGLQHYAALGGDIEGGTKVNLLPSDAPQDVYSGVSDLVNAAVNRDAENGVEIAKAVQGFIKRKTVKQTVMTYVYGVTFIGGREQIYGQLKDLKMAEEVSYRASLYIAQKTFEALAEMFNGARAIMSWLADCAQMIARTGSAVEWTTPLGLHVVQPYRVKDRFIVKTVLQSVSLVSNSEQLPISVARQRSAFPPNYVHSLDSCHMLMTAVECHKRGLAFASVHDSFWTHACDVTEMGDILRDRFIHLHKQPLLDMLRTSFVKSHASIDFAPVPQRGALDLERIRESKYFFD